MTQLDERQKSDARLSRGWQLLALPILLAVVGAALLHIASSMPAYSDQAAFDAGYERLSARAYADGLSDTAALSRDHFELQNRLVTNRWLLTDLGYASFSWAAVLTLLVVPLRGDLKRLCATSQHRVFLTTLFAACYVAFFVGSGWSVLVGLSRGYAPWWADSVAIPLFFTMSVAIILLLPFLGLLLWAAYRRKRPAHAMIFINRRSPIMTTVSTLIYVPIALYFVAATALVVTDPGGWLVSPASAGLAWLALNARVLAIAPNDEKSPVAAV